MIYSKVVNINRETRENKGEENRGVVAVKQLQILRNDCITSSSWLYVIGFFAIVEIFKPIWTWKERILLFKSIKHITVIYLIYLHISLQLNEILLDRRIHRTPQCLRRAYSIRIRLDLLHIHWCPGHSFCLSTPPYRHTHWQCHTQQLQAHTDTLGYSFRRN